MITFLALYIAIQETYTTKLVNHLLKQYAIFPVSVRKASFQFPNHLSFQSVEIKELQTDPINIEKLDIWISSDSIFQAKPIIDSMLVNGVLLQNGFPNIPMFKDITLHQLAITHLDYSKGDFISRDTNIQIENPHFSRSDQQIPYGSIQYSAEQIYWQKEAFNNVLIDMNYKAKNSTLYGASFKWRGGEFSTQAEQYEQGWSLVNMTIDKLRLNIKQWHEIDTTNWSFLFNKIYHINSLDILDSSVETDNINITNGNISMENISISNGIWQQKEGYVSFNAESINYQNQLWLDPAFKSNFNNNLISIDVLSFEFKQGLVKAVGQLTPHSVHLDNLSIDGIKWIYETPSNMTSITRYLTALNDLTLDNVEIKNTQFIQMANQPNWQFSDLSANGQHLVLMKKNNVGLWNGQIRISANNASYKNLISSQPLITMQSNDGIWHLDEALIPLEKGLIDATATYTLSTPSQPWRLEAFVDGIPLSLFSQWLSFPMNIEAIAEFQLGLSGLGGDELMLRHSLTGQLVGSLRDSMIQQDIESNQTNLKSFESSEFVISMDRGRIHLAPVTIKGKSLNGQLQGNVDLLDTTDNNMVLELTENDIKHSYNLIHKNPTK